MTDRDTFAAAALPFVARRGLTDEQVAAHCYKWADVMLRERGTSVSTGNQREMEYPVTEPMTKEKRAEVSFTLTDEEREAIHQAAIRVEALCQIGSQQRAATLRKLLERLA